MWGNILTHIGVHHTRRLDNGPTQKEGGARSARDPVPIPRLH
jgi:hypothetical protein